MTSRRAIVVITQARSGSNLLLDYLGQIPGVIPLGEIFRDKKPPGVHAITKHFEVSAEALSQLHELQARNLAEFWGLLTQLTAANDFRAAAKIFYEHASPINLIWSALKRATVLHLVRENVLAAVVSKRLAARASQWQARSYQADYDSEKIEITERECLRHLKNLRADVRWVKETFGACDYSELTYDDIANLKCAETVLGKALDHSITLKKQTVAQQRKRAINEVVANYDEVAHFNRNFNLISRA